MSSQRISKSEQLYSRAMKVMPGGSQMYNKRPSIYAPCKYPIFVKEVQGAHFVDVDNNEYIDYLLAYGAIVLGYNYPIVRDAVINQIKQGTIFSVNHELEIELAEELIRTIPSAEMVRYFLSGSAATSAAVRMARAYTGKEKIIHWGYHGWHDWCVTGVDGSPKGLLEYFESTNCPLSSLNGVPSGVRQYTLELRYNDLNFLEDLLKEEGDNVACIIMEPFYFDLPQDGFLEGVKNLAHQYDALLVFDEVKTGCRVSPGGAQEYYGVIPDLSVFGKAISNGYPLSLVVGKKEVMKVNEGLWYAGTNSGNTVGIAAALSTIREIKHKNVTNHIWRLGRKLMSGLDRIANDLGVEGKSMGLPPMFAFRFTARDKEMVRKMENIFLCECVKRGIFYPKNHVWFICYSHEDVDINKTLEVSKEALKAVKEKV